MNSALRRDLLLALQAARTKRHRLYRAALRNSELRAELEALHLDECAHEARILKLLLRHAEPTTPTQEQTP